MKAMVLGAGAGTRLDPITRHIPKPLVPIANRPVIDHIIELLHKHGFNQLVCNIHYMADKMESHFKERNSEITLVHEEQLSGDAGGVRACREFLKDDTFLVIMGDLLTDADLTSMLSAHKKRNSIATIAVKKVEDVSRFGVLVIDEHGLVTDFQEKPAKEEARSNQISTGIYILEPEIFDYIPPEGMYGFGRLLFPDLVQRGLAVNAFEVQGYWTDIGTLSDYFRANCDVLKRQVDVSVPGEKTHFGWAGEGTTIDSTASMQGQIMVGNGGRVEAGASLRGTVIVGDGAVVGKNASLKDCILLPGSSVSENSHIECSIVAETAVASF